MLLDHFHSSQVLSRRVRVLAGHLAAMAPADAEILDVGCGDGQIARILLDRRSDERRRHAGGRVAKNTQVINWK